MHHVYTWMHVDTRGCAWEHVDARGCAWMNVDARGYTWIHMAGSRVCSPLLNSAGASQPPQPAAGVGFFCFGDIACFS